MLSGKKKTVVVLCVQPSGVLHAWHFISFAASFRNAHLVIFLSELCLCLLDKGISAINQYPEVEKRYEKEETKMLEA